MTELLARAKTWILIKLWVTAMPKSRTDIVSPRPGVLPRP